MANKGHSEEQVSLQLDRAWRNIFEKYDLDRDEKLSLDEFKNFLKDRNQELQNDLPVEVLNEIIERVDWDKNRYITYNEFLRMIHSRDVLHQHPRAHDIIYLATKFTVPKKERNTVIRKYFDEYEHFRFPYFIVSISLIQIALFTYRWSKYGPFVSDGLLQNILIYDPHKRKEIWRFLTYMLVHRDVLHLIYNILGQITIGITLELVHTWRVMVLCLCGVIAGSLYSAITDPQTYICGASGGVYALITAHTANLIINFKEIDYAIYQLFWLSLVTISDLGQAVYCRYYGVTGERSIAYVAHIAGAITGFLLGLFILRNLRVRKFEQILSYCALALFVFEMVTALVYNIMMTPPFDDKKW